MGRSNNNRNISSAEISNRNALLAARVRKGFHKLFPFAQGDTVCLNGSIGSYQNISATPDSITINTYREGSRDNAWDMDHVINIRGNPITVTMVCEDRPYVEKREPIVKKKPRSIGGRDSYRSSWGEVRSNGW